jgi:hypothetical protein
MLLAVPRLPAIGDLRQELADMFDFGLCPCVDGPGSNLKNCRSRQLSRRNVAGKSIKVYAQLLGSLPGRDNFHSTTSVDDSPDIVKQIFHAVFTEQWDVPAGQDAETKSALQWHTR